MRDKPCHREAVVSLQMATVTYTAAVYKFGGGAKKFFGTGFNIVLNIGFNILVQYWVPCLVQYKVSI